jgi:hypothetical protein
MENRVLIDRVVCNNNSSLFPYKKVRITGSLAEIFCGVRLGRKVNVRISWDRVCSPRSLGRILTKVKRAGELGCSGQNVSRN